MVYIACYKCSNLNDHGRMKIDPGMMWSTDGEDEYPFL